MNKLRILIVAFALFTIFIGCTSQKQTFELSELEKRHPEIPSILSPNIKYEKETGRMYLLKDKNKFYLKPQDAPFTIDNFVNCEKGTDKGIAFDFKNKNINGSLHFGMIPEDDGIAPQTVFYRNTVPIINGKADIDIVGNLTGRYDFNNWQKNKRGLFGYRVIDTEGNILYDGKIYFKGNGPFVIDTSIIEGPFVNNISTENAFISFTTNFASICTIKIDDQTIVSSSKVHKHEFFIRNLKPSTKYAYTIYFGNNTFTSYFITAPEFDTRGPFTFAFASDGRNSRGGGERDMFGVNKYITKKVFAFAQYKDAAFFQFTGDLISGYKFNRAQMQLEYTNWKRTIEPFAHNMPVYIGFGNHESLCLSFDDGSKYGLSVNKFPYGIDCGESLFAENFVLPLNGPHSEDNSRQDPFINTIDFPSYKENVYHYTYDNVGVIVLNSNYWYSPSRMDIPYIGGNLHGYIMDNQLTWLIEVLAIMERLRYIDHVFITIHTPFFPNGGHVKDAMWYNGSNEPRPYIAGKPVSYGIIERRDQLLQTIINGSTKVRAILCGDEHNYSRTLISPDMNMYPVNWELLKIELNRSIWQITNGSAGAPYYGQEETPWSDNVKKFSIQYAICLFNVHGDSIILDVYNPDTLELIETVKIH